MSKRAVGQIVGDLEFAMACLFGMDM